jgi:ABC-type sugar transport system permease subunit
LCLKEWYVLSYFLINICSVLGYNWRSLKRPTWQLFAIILWSWWQTSAFGTLLLLMGKPRKRYRVKWFWIKHV